MTSTDLDRARVVVRPEAPAEVAAVRALAVDAFGDPVLGRLLDSLRASDAWIDGLSLVATYDGEVVGQVLLTGALLDAPERLVDVLVLSPLAVAPAYQRRGIGSMLVRAALVEAARRPEPLVFLEGSPAYYPRFGFAPGGDLGFRKPSLRIPDAAFMVVRQPSYEPWMTGTLVYPDAFWRHDCVGLR